MNPSTIAVALDVERGDTFAHYGVVQKHPKTKKITEMADCDRIGHVKSMQRKDW